jgi:hypothetical protein
VTLVVAIAASPAIPETLPLKKLPVQLLKVWFSWDFVRNRRAHFLPVAFGILFWWRVIVGTFAGIPPLLGWMSSALLSVVLTTTVIQRLFRRATGVGQYSPAMLLLQFTVIILANSFVVGLMLWLGMYFRVADVYILGWAAIGLSIVVIGMFVTEAKAMSDWALCGYSISLKSVPQVVQAVWLAKGIAKLDPWSAVFLFCQGLSRLVLSFGMWRASSTVTSRAQLMNASVDQLTITPIFAIVLWQSWEQMVAPLLPHAKYIVTIWETIR